MSSYVLERPISLIAAGLLFINAVLKECDFIKNLCNQAYQPGGKYNGHCDADIYDKVTPDIQKLGLDTECVGGGRINHDADAKNIKVYGYSQGYGKADHKMSVAVLKKKYPEYEITWTDDGY